MSKKHLKENTFDGAPGGSGGISNYQAPYGTPGGGDISQDPGHFSASDKTVNHMDTNNSGSTDYSDKKVTSISPNKATSEFDSFETDVSNKPMNPEDKINKDVDKIFKKKITPSPDDIMSALQYELGQMIKKDKTVAKQVVLKNLKKDPTFYRNLNMLNIDDEKMKVDETTVSKTKQLLDQMIAEKKRQLPPAPPNLDSILKELWKKRYGHRE